MRGRRVSQKDVGRLTAPATSLTKTATIVVVTYNVVVTNDSTAEDLFLDALSDDKFGNSSYPCSFDGKVSTSPHTNVVTGTVSDNEGGDVMPSDSATVTFE